MSKSVIVGVIVAVIVVGGSAAFLATHKDSTKTNNAASTAGTASGSSADKTSSDAQGVDVKNSGTSNNSVNIENFAFDKASITIQKGTTVTWTNKDSTAHTVTETDGKNGPNSGSIAPGKSFVFTFDETGTYQYHCTFHGSMTGTITVTD